MDTTKVTRRARRAHKTRTKLSEGSTPRFSVYRSHKTLQVQIIDDARGSTLVSAHSNEVTGAKSRMEQAKKLGELIATKAKEKKIETVRFDRGGYKYQGLVKAIAEGARKGGLTF